MLIDVHGHPPRVAGGAEDYFAALARWDSRLLVSFLGPLGRGYLAEPSFEELSQGNDDCAAFVRAHPDVLAGYCYVNPSRTQEALAEMEKRLVGQADAFAALKLWVAVRCSDARLDPLMEFCAAHGVPVLQHTWMKVGPSGPGSGNLPGESTATYSKIALDAVGAGRIVYGTDVAGRSVPSQLAKVMCLDVPAADLDRMLWRNAAEVLGTRLPAAWKIGGPATAPDRGAGGP